MDVIVYEPAESEATELPPTPPWSYEPDVAEPEVIQTVRHEETPTEPGYGHGV